MSQSALLFTSDTTLQESVANAAKTNDAFRFQVAKSLDAGWSALSSPDLALILYHIGNVGDQGEILRMLDDAPGIERIPVVVISDDYDASTAIQLFRRGVADYMARPISISRLAVLFEVFSWRQGREAAAEQLEPCGDTPDAIPRDTFLSCRGEMEDILEQARHVARTGATILLTGETGTGKTRLARLIHDHSPRRAKPMIAINCGALATNLVESEMFGHVRGAFTGADRDRVGKFAAAGSGTLMLDEIDTLSPMAQSKLLRAIDERVFERVGSNQTEELKARLIVATNRCLETEMAAGRFRSDLFYRINVISFHLPPLRERRSLIRPLAKQCVAEFSARHGCPEPELSPVFLAALEAYRWPGNIRELRNVIERAVALCRNGHLALADLPRDIQGQPGEPIAGPPAAGHGTKWQQTKQRAEAQVVAEALARNGNVRIRAAKELGISRVTLYKKLRKYGMM